MGLLGWKMDSLYNAGGEEELQNVECSVYVC